jgi:hypothetical protein
LAPTAGTEELGEDVLPEQPARRLTATVVHSAADNRRIGGFSYRIVVAKATPFSEGVPRVGSPGSRANAAPLLSRQRDFSRCNENQPSIGRPNKLRPKAQKGSPKAAVFGMLGSWSTVYLPPLSRTEYKKLGQNRGRVSFSRKDPARGNCNWKK